MSTNLYVTLDKELDFYSKIITFGILVIKITEDTYYLPHIFAQTLFDDFQEGTNLPVLISGVDTSNNTSGRYVLKMMSSERMSPDACMKEIVASFIATELGIPIPEPTVILITDEFISSQKGDQRYLRLSKSLGKNFGNKYYPGFVTWNYDKALFNVQFIDFQKIFIFDMFIDNTDRSSEKPNIMTDHQNILIIDHEIAFGFTQLLFGDNADKDLITKSQYANLDKHVLYKYLRGNDFLCDAFMDSFTNINDNFWHRVLSFVPDEWQNDNLEKIMKILNFKINNIIQYKTEIMRCLS